MSKAKPNFFYVNRELLYSDRWLSEPFTRGQAWIDLFGLAQHSSSFFRVRGIRVDVNRGQLAYSQKTLAKRWKWSRNKIIRYLKELENQGDIEQQNNNIITIITIIKYDLWQGNGTPDGTPERHQKDIRRVTYNNVNNVNNENKENIVEQSSTGFSLKEEVEKIWKGKRKDLKIIAHYFQVKGYSYENKEQFQSALKRELRPAKLLIGYSSSQIDLAIDFCFKKYTPDMWKLETLSKVIDEAIK